MNINNPPSRHGRKALALAFMALGLFAFSLSPATPNANANTIKQSLDQHFGDHYSGPQKHAWDTYVFNRITEGASRRDAWGACVRSCEDKYSSANEMTDCVNSCHHFKNTLDK